ncbi:serine hydrolase domain-containing protein [Kineobactrum salinum]|uniref:Beta-lactamase family protein n=1 Tax=Kineobactrum salinum TaxID=2708301 RepID=A0A6C0TYG9_9GAMM|nr:serine hydrolase domain-containing protein [Kineobactrum salinum]QIB64851.1 beta-lactamase family protein [Kineobactrum salinum]
MLAAVASASWSVEPWRAPENAAAQLDALLASEVAWQQLTPAYTVLVDVGGKAVYTNNIGFADVEHRIPASTDTVYQIGSISKSYTALAVLQLVESGDLQLDKSVADYLPDYNGPGRDASLRQLLTHTSGIPSYTALPDAEQLLTWVPNQREDILRLFADKPLDFEPGSHYLYSNSGYYLLGLILEEVTGQDYYALLQERVLDPLQLERTYSGRYGDIVNNRARGYLVTEEGFENAPPTPHLTPFAAGSIQTTAEDLVRYRRAVFTSPAVSKKLRELVTTTFAFADGTPQIYSLGALTRADHLGYTVWSHSGGISGFISHHAYYPELDMTVVVLTNTGNPPVAPSTLASKVATVMLGGEITEVTSAQTTIDSERLRHYSGNFVMTPFRLTADGLFTLLYQDETLLARLGKADDEQAPTVPLSAVGQRQFIGEGLPLEVRVLEDDGVVTGLEIMVAEDGPFPAIPAATL